MLMSLIIFLSVDMELSKSVCSGQTSSGKLAGGSDKDSWASEKKVYTFPSLNLSSRNLPRCGSTH